MNLRDLKYLVAVADEKHFGRAAEKCFVSQPTLSMQVKKLEEELGFQFFERNNKSVYITQGAEKLIQQARQILIEADGLKMLAALQKDPECIEIKLAAIPTIAPYLLPKALPKVKKNLPQMKLQIHEYQTEVLLQKLKDGLIDVGILALPAETEGFTTLKLFEEDFFVAMTSNHPLSNKTTIKLKELENQNLLLLSEGHCLRDQALSVCQHIQTANKNYEAASLETLRYTVAMDDGITLMPEMAANTQGDVLTYRPFADVQPTRTIGMVWRKSSPSQSCFEKLAGYLAQ